ncbi:MAG: PH domain-containing protein [Anaerolineales bacterium]
MEAPIRFDPPRRRGGLLHVAALLLCAALAIGMLTLATLRPTGIAVILLLVGATLFSLPLPVLFYRLYALTQSGYWVGRDGLRLRWGLRLVDLPRAAIVDVARREELEHTIPLPRWAWPGSIMGSVQHEELGTVEFLASEKNEQVLLGTKERVYVISPRNAQNFVEVYKRESERGSLRALKARSVSPSFVLVEAWQQSQVRRLFIAGALLALALLLLVGVLGPSLETVTLGFGADGLPLSPVAGLQLFLLPALNLFFYVGNLFLGLLFFREAKGLSFSYILWGSSLLTSVFFLGAVLFSL